MFGASGKETAEELAYQKKFVKSMLDKYDISPKTTQIGAITYGREAVVAMPLGGAANKVSTVHAIDGIRIPGDGNNLKRALEVARDRLFVEKLGARRNVPKTLILFTNKKLLNLPSELAIIASSLEKRGIKIVVVGIGSEVDKKQLAKLAEDKNTFFFPPSLEEMERNVLPVVEASKPGIHILFTFFYLFT